MDQQTKVVNRNGVPEIESQGLAGDVNTFVSDVLTLAELQSQLLNADIREFAGRVWILSLVLIGGLALGLACLPIALLTVALGLVQLLGISYFTAFLIVGVVAAIGSALMSIVGWIQICQRTVVLRRSWAEFARNLRWIKKVFTSKRLR